MASNALIKSLTKFLYILWNTVYISELSSLSMYHMPTQLIMYFDYSRKPLINDGFIRHRQVHRRRRQVAIVFLDPVHCSAGEILPQHQKPNPVEIVPHSDSSPGGRRRLYVVQPA